MSLVPPPPQSHEPHAQDARSCGIFEAIFRINPVAMAMTRLADGTVLDINDACCTMLGLTRESALGRSSLDLNVWLSPDQRATIVDRLRQGLPVRHHELRTAGGRFVRLSMERHTLDGEECLLTVVEDITGWRGAEDALHATETRWSLALENADTGVWDWNAQTGEVYFSDRWKAMLGYAPHEIRPHVDEWASRVHPDDLADTMALLDAHLEGRAPEYISEHRLRCRDGSYRWILDRGKVVSRTPDGRPLRAVGTHTDVTARHEAEARRHAEERRFRAIFNSTFQFIGLLSPDGTLLEANQTALDFAGISLEDVAGHPFWEAPWWRGNPLSQTRLRQAVATAASGEFVRYEVDVQNHAGRLVTIDFSLKPITDDTGQVVLLVPEGRDISEVRQTQMALRDSQERFRSAFVFAGIGMALVALDGRFLMVNESLCDLVGYDEPTLRALTFQDITHPDDLQLDLEQARRLAAGEIQRYQMEKRYIHRSGQHVWIRLTGSAVRADTGEPQYFIAQVEDISAQKAMLEGLETAVHQKGVLLWEVHHRVKNNLQVVGSLLSLQMRTVPEGPTRDALEDSRRRVQALALVHEQLYLGNNSGDAVDMRRYLRDLTGLITRAFGADVAGVTIACEAIADELPVDIATPCGMIVNELVSNALKYAFPDGRRGTVQVSLTRAGDDMILEVADDGVGVTGALPADSLRMKLVDGLARQLRGTVTIDSADGMRVGIRFPLARPATR
jgi:PAS domain S-box-containing protein